MSDWKKGEIVWEKPNDNEDNHDNDDNQKWPKTRWQTGGSAYRDKERKKEPKKERNETPVVETFSSQEKSMEMDDSEGISF